MEGESSQIQDANETTTKIDSDEELTGNVDNTADTELENESLTIDLTNKMCIIYNVLKACIQEKKENVYYYKDHVLNRLAYLTKLQTHLLSEFMNNTQELETTDVLEESILETPDLDLLIRQTLVKHYVKYNSIPKSESLNYIALKLRYNCQLKQQLKRSGYIWWRLPNTKNTIIIEHPKRALERYNYLQSIINYRKAKRRIVYIETKIFTKADKDICYFLKYLTEDVEFIVVFIAVVNNNEGFLKGHIIVSPSIYECQKLVEDYVTTKILPNLSEPSVIVLEDKPYYRKSFPVPTMESEKSEMIKWLQINGLPHDENVHRSELFDLIETFKTKRDLHNFDTVLHSHGHEILRRPSRTDYLNYYKSLWNNLHSTEDVIVFISKKSPEYWINLETLLTRMEQSILNEDIAMENIIDKILTMANNIDIKKWAEVECDVGQDSLFQEEFLNEINNTFSREEMEVREKQFLLEIQKFKQAKEK